MATTTFASKILPRPSCYRKYRKYDIGIDNRPARGLPDNKYISLIKRAQQHCFKMIDDKLPDKWTREDATRSESWRINKQTNNTIKEYHTTYDLAPLLRPSDMTKLYMTVFQNTEVNFTTQKFNFDEFIIQSEQKENYNELVMNYCGSIVDKCQETIGIIETESKSEEEIKKMQYLEKVWIDLIKKVDSDLFETVKDSLNFGNEYYSKNSLEIHTQIDGMIEQITFRSMHTRFDYVAFTDDLNYLINQIRPESKEQTLDLVCLIINNEPEI
jgi:hypothetical protein